MTQKQKEREEAVARLREWLKPGDTVYTHVQHVSRSGMSRVIQAYFMENNEPRWIGYNVAKAIGEPYDEKREGVKIGGCGMDMGFQLVYLLSHALYHEYKCPGKDKCHSPDHHNSGARDNPPKIHSDGYALRQRWL